MPKLTIVKNPLIPEDKFTFVCEELIFTEFFNKCIETNPKVLDILKSDNFSFRVNGAPVDDPLRAMNLRFKQSDSIVLYPDIEIDPATWAAILAGIQAGLAAATTGATIAFGGVAVTTGVVIGYGLGVVAMGAVLGGISMGLNALFAPSMDSPSGPTAGSPSYGWDISPTSKEGIAIPVVYGQHLVGGNILTQAKEYKIKEPWEWQKSSKKETELSAFLPFLNLWAVGFDEPVRGVSIECELDTPYLFFRYRLWDENIWDNFWNLFFERIEEGIILTGKTIELIISAITLSQTKDISKKSEDLRIPLAAMINDKNVEVTESKVLAHAEQNLKRNSNIGDLVLFLDPDKTDHENASISHTIFDTLTELGVLNGSLEFDYFDPYTQGDDYTVIFQDEADNTINSGAWIVGCIIIGPEALGVQYTGKFLEIIDLFYIIGKEIVSSEQVEALLHSFGPIGDAAWLAITLLPDAEFDLDKWIAFETVTPEFRANVKEVYRREYGTTNAYLQKIRKPDDMVPDIRYNQTLHQLTALSEGTCTGVSQVYVNDAPALMVPGFSYSFFDGRNDQYMGNRTSNSNTYDNYNRTTVFHKVEHELIERGDYCEFVTSPNFGVANVIVETNSTVYRVSSNGHIRPMDTSKGQTPLEFAIQVGFSWSQFDTYTPGADISASMLTEGMFLFNKYELHGQKDTMPTIGRYACLPIRDFFMSATDMDLIVSRFPGMALGLCAWLSILPLDEEYDHVLYLNQRTYAELVNNLIRERLIALFTDQGVGLKIRVIRLTDGGYDSGAKDLKITGFQELSYDGYDYPNTACLGISFKATSSFNTSIPKVTTVLKGKKVLVPILMCGQTKVQQDKCWFDEDFGLYRSTVNNGNKCRYYRDSNNRIVFEEQYSNNPAWCVYDLIINKRYGLGNFTSQLNLPIDWFMSAAEYCDTVVPDGTVRFARTVEGVSLITERTLTDQDSDFFNRANQYYDQNYLDLKRKDTYNGGTELVDYLQSINPFVYDTIMQGRVIFAKKEDGSWTKAIVEHIARTLPGLDIFVNQADMYFRKDFTTYNQAGGSDYWSNGLPCNNVASPNYAQYQISEKRFTLDIAVDNTSSAMDWVKTLFDTFRAYPVWIGGGYKPVINKLEEPVATIGMGNVLRGSVQVSYAPLSKSYNLIEAEFMNRENQFKKDTRQIVDADVDVSIAPEVFNALRKKTVKLFGITRPSQIQRELTFQLLNSKVNHKLVNFSMGVEHLNLTAGDTFYFNHYIIKSDSKSGRLQGFEAGFGRAILDQDVSDVSLPALLSITHLIGTAYCEKCSKYIWTDASNTVLDIEASVCPTCDTPIEGVEVVKEYTPTSIDGKYVYFAIDSRIIPKAFDNYIIGEADDTLQKYRAIQVQPDEHGQAVISGIEDDESVYGSQRTLFNGGVTAYDDVELTTQDNRTSIFGISTWIQPVKHVTVFPSRIDQKQIEVKFAPPASAILLNYTGGEVKVHSVEDGQIFNQIVEDGGIGQLVTLTARDRLYTVEVRAMYTGGTYSDPVKVYINLQTYDYDGMGLSPSPAQVTGLRLQPHCKPLQEMYNDDYTQFTTNDLDLEWNPVAEPDEDDNPFTPNSVQIAGYTLKAYFRINDSQPWIEAKEYTLGKYETVKRVTLLDIIPDPSMYTASTEALAEFTEVKIAVWARSELGYKSELPNEEIFTPWPPNTPEGVGVIELWGSALVWWAKPDLHENVDHYEVQIRLEASDWNWMDWGGSAEWISEWETTTDLFKIIKIDDEAKFDFNPLGILWGARINAIVHAVTKVGGLRSSRSSGINNGDVPPGASLPQTGIPDYMLQSPATNIIVYDGISQFLLTPSVGIQRTFNYTPSVADRNKLIDGQLGTGITYSPLGWSGLDFSCVRITYQSPTEQEFSRVVFNTDVACRVWVEYLEQDAHTGDYITGDWAWLGGDSNNDLDGGDLVEYSDRLTAITKWWECEAGSNAANFPVPISNKYLRLVVSPLSGNSVTVKEIRFVRVGTFEEISVDLIKNQDWDSGDEKFYLDANATGLVSGESGNEPVFWAADGGIGGTRDTPDLKLTPQGIVQNSPTGYMISGENGQPDWSPVDQWYLNEWKTEIVFSSDDHDDIQWTGGDITFGDSLTYTITAGSAVIPNDGSSYVYFNRDNSETIFSVTNTFSDLVVPGIVLIARGVENSDEDQHAMIIGQGIVFPTIAQINISPNVIDTIHIVEDAVTATEIKALTITSTEIKDETITASEIAANTITAGQIKALTITSNEIKAETITASEIAANTITAGQIKALTITASEIAANTITAGQIKALTITSNEIKALTITADEIATNAITSAKILAGTIVAADIHSGTITATEMHATNVRGLFANFGTMEGGIIQNSGYSSTPKFQINLNTSVITVKGTGGLVISGTNGMTVTGDINVTTGNIKIGSGGDIDIAASGDINFTGCCIFNSTVSANASMRILPNPSTGYSAFSVGLDADRFYTGWVYASSSAGITAPIVSLNSEDGLLLYVSDDTSYTKAIFADLSNGRTTNAKTRYRLYVSGGFVKAI